MVTNKELNDKKDASCMAVLTDKKYFNINNKIFMKRTLRRSEWQTSPTGSLLIPTPTLRSRWENEAASLAYLSAHTEIPIPTLQGTFEDDGAFSFMTDYIAGVGMDTLQLEEQAIVVAEVERLVATLHSLRSKTPGVPGASFICPPYRVFRGWRAPSIWRLKETKENKDEEYVFCHNDLGQHNIIVDPTNLKILAIVDWEFAGFFPCWFEAQYWRRRGPSCAIGNEEDNADRLRAWLVEKCEEVKIVWPDVWLDEHREGTAMLDAKAGLCASS